MKKLLRIVVFTMFFIGLVACAKEPTVESITAPDLAALIAAADAPLILDVRTQKEFSAGHIPGAVNIPHTELEDRIAELSNRKNQTIVLHCRSGRLPIRTTRGSRGRNSATPWLSQRHRTRRTHARMGERQLSRRTTDARRRVTFKSCTDHSAIFRPRSRLKSLPQPPDHPTEGAERKICRAAASLTAIFLLQVIALFIVRHDIKTFRLLV